MKAQWWPSPVIAFGVDSIIGPAEGSGKALTPQSTRKATGSELAPRGSSELRGQLVDRSATSGAGKRVPQRPHSGTPTVMAELEHAFDSVTTRDMAVRRIPTSC